jgi:hypothetical protein
MDESEEEVEGSNYDYSNLQQWLNGDVASDASDVTVSSQSEPQLACTRCRDSWSSPALTPQQRSEVAELYRRENILEPMEFFRLAGFTPVAAKRTMLHITRLPGRCHKCGRELPEGSEQAVRRCRSLNLNW